MCRPVDRSITVSRAPANRPRHLVDLLADRRRGGRVADVRVDLHEKIAADDRGFELRMVHVGRQHGAPARDFGAHELGPDALANRDELHLRRDLAATRVVHLRHVRAGFRAPRPTRGGETDRLEFGHRLATETIERRCLLERHRIAPAFDPTRAHRRETESHVRHDVGIRIRTARIVHDVALAVGQRDRAHRHANRRIAPDRIRLPRASLRSPYLIRSKSIDGGGHFHVLPFRRDRSPYAGMTRIRFGGRRRHRPLSPYAGSREDIGSLVPTSVGVNAACGRATAAVEAKGRAGTEAFGRAARDRSGGDLRTLRAHRSRPDRRLRIATRDRGRRRRAARAGYGPPLAAPRIRARHGGRRTRDSLRDLDRLAALHLGRAFDTARHDHADLDGTLRRRAGTEAARASVSRGTRRGVRGRRARRLRAGGRSRTRCGARRPGRRARARRQRRDRSLSARRARGGRETERVWRG